MARLLIVDDEASLCQMLEIAFRNEGHTVETVSSARAALKKIESQVYDLIISDIRMPDLTGIDVLARTREIHPSAAFILITAFSDAETARQAVNLGAQRYVIKTDKLLDELKQAVARTLEETALREENIRLRSELLRVFARQNIIGRSPKIQAILEMIRTVAPTTSTILITGESGTGKELVARAIHEASARREKPFVSINCGAFPETLLESELFGYLKGSFTGADTNRKGIIESATGGSLFLDEIGETSLLMQVKLLRVLQQRTVRPLGGTVDVPIDVRLIASTNRDLPAMVKAGQFREDFYYRVSVIPIHVPPLRERPDDIEPLARAFLRKFALQMGKPVSDFQPEAVEAMVRYPWPGNVRELENAIERAVAVSQQGDGVVRLEHLPESVALVRPSEEKGIVIPPEGVYFESEIAALERGYLCAALAKASGVGTRAAEFLHVSYRSFRHYAKKHGVSLGPGQT
ncbi:MAG TPA: sigma-54 dependent transcriptional regulator [Terriglobia bacterium]|nr:sigma-54 dependent transcriptional regulator [Terriglobia bacterium]